MRGADAGAPGAMKVSLISPYEIGRQPFALAEPAAWLSREGFEVVCMDLSIDSLNLGRIEGSGVIALHLAMHAGARLAASALPAIAARFPDAVICVFGLYAPVNADYFRSLGVGHVFGGESEPDIVQLCRRVRDQCGASGSDEAVVRLDKIEFVMPKRDGLPALDQYSRLVLADGSMKTVGFVEASRGCKHVCRHCPVVPVYGGTFRIVRQPVVMADIEQQIDSGAEHISFGDPDFLNGPSHARRIVDQLHSAYPDMTWDATVKIEHLLKHSDIVAQFAEKGCLFMTSAVESTEDMVLDRLEKGHSAADFEHALAMMRRVGIFLAPTFVPFTPWTTLQGYCGLLRKVAELDLVHAVAPVQLSIRLLLPLGSRLLESDDCDLWLGPFDPELLGYGWSHPDPQVDALQDRVQRWVMESEEREVPRMDVFAGIWEMAHAAAAMTAGEIPDQRQTHVPHMTEPWYCCAEPTANQFSLML